MMTAKSKSLASNFTNCNFDQTLLRRGCADWSIAEFVCKCWHLRTSQTNDKSFVPGYWAMSGHTYMILRMPLSLFDSQCAPPIWASRMKRPWSLLPHNMAAKHTLE